jgi:HipA-like protein
MAKLWHYRYKTPPPILIVLYQGVRVAELQKYVQGYIFRYLPIFRDMNLTAFPGLPLEKGDLAFEELPAFFQERLPDMRRPEIRQRLQELGISSDDELRLLATLGSHAVTDPYELRLVAAA